MLERLPLCPRGCALTVLLIDNHDSYTWNLAHLIADLTGQLPMVVKNDAIDVEAALALRPDAIVLSPGPGRPGVERDLGVCAELIRHFNGPLLGVCLGHQALGWVHGATIERAPEAWHGRTSEIEHDGTGLFRGLPANPGVVRYHSLHIKQPLPERLVVTAQTADGVVMALRDTLRPHVGVQFHPESIGTAIGRDLLGNFLRDAGIALHGPPTPAPKTPAEPRSDVRVLTRALEHGTDAEAAFCTLFAGRFGACWLDSAGRQGSSPSRFSYLAAADGPLGHILCWDGATGGTERTAHGPPRPVAGSLLQRLRTGLNTHKTSSNLPFSFVGGWVGWLGYAAQAEQSDAAFAFVDRLVVIDHDTDQTWLVALVRRGQEDSARAWFNTAASTLTQLPELPPAEPPCTPGLAPAVSKRHYLRQIAQAQAQILDGESYEICLTTPLVTVPLPDPLAAYRRLRHLNPAPYGAFLDLPDATVLSSSPERFLSVSQEGVVQARPIKGTAPRHPDPTTDRAYADKLESSEKDRAENLMIVDLLRHDLGRVCAPASVRVPSLMAVEAFTTVHHLVSTIEGDLAPGADALSAIDAAFPPGSMTGAPKTRTVAILNRLEPHRRGIYSGAFGWMSVNGASDLAVTIRTAVVTAGRTTVGVGGAITALSDPAAEWEEALLKGKALDLALCGASEATAERRREPSAAGDPKVQWGAS
ncbi:MAG: aminodeoxychorismate synthase component I [Myxococcota bacterium]